MRKIMGVVRLLGVSAFGALSVLQPLAADETSDFYAGKQLTFTLGFAAGGGGYDLYARTFARHYGRHVPGEPNVVVQNMPGGGGGMRAANYLYNVAPRDGPVIGMFAGSTAFEPLFDRSVAKFETPKFTWIGNMDESTGTCAAWHTAPVQRFDDLFTREIVFGASGAAGTSAQYPRLFKNLLGAKGKLVTGYTSTNEIILAMQRGEVQANCAMSLSVLKSQWAELWTSGQLRVFVQLGLQKSPDLASVPHIFDYAKTDADRQILDLVFGQQALGRPVAAPPGLPADRTKALRAAFMQTMNDEGFRADAQKANLNLAPSSGEAVSALVARFFSYSPKIVARASEALK